MKKEEKSIEVKFTCTEEEYEMIKQNAKNCDIPVSRLVMASIHYFDRVLKGKRICKKTMNLSVMKYRKG